MYPSRTHAGGLRGVKIEPSRSKFPFSRSAPCHPAPGAVKKGFSHKMLELKNVSYRAGEGAEEKEIINHVNLCLCESFIALTGPNGGGKSTLAKLIAGIYVPTEGQILFNGQDITHASITDRARMGIGYAFQQPVRFKGITVSDLITLASGRKLSMSEICDYLSEVGLCAREYVNREVNASLSGGELKRIEIAMATARAAKLTVFDEPEAGIDLWSFGNLISVFEKMHEKLGGTILIISHQERILNIADRIIVIAGGKIEKDGTRDEVLPGLLQPKTCAVLTGKL